MDRKFDIDASPPTPELLEIARNELRETPEVREAAIKELRRLLAEATDLCYKDDDDFLLIFLRPCHFYPESAIKLMRRIAEFKKYYHDLLHNLMPEDEKAAFCDHKVVNVLTNLDQKGRRVLVVNCGSLWDPKQISSNQLFRMFYLIHVVAQQEPSSQINGVVVIMDFDGLSLKQAAALSPTFSKLLLTFIQEALPLRLKEVHIVKQPFIFKMVWKLFTPFIKEKLNKRMFFHGSDMKKFHQYLSADVLPENYGGNLPAIDYSGKDWYPCVDKYIDHIRRYNECGFAEKSEK